MLVNLGMKERNKRIKTDYSKNTNSKPQVFTVKIRDDRYSLQKRVTSLGNRQIFISRILQSINHDQNYESSNQVKLLKEKENLKIKVKEMKEALGCMLERQLQKKNEEQRVLNKATIGKEMGINFDNLSKECIHNRQTIAVLEQEFKDNNQKLITLCNSNSKLSRAKSISETEEKVKEMKKLMSRMKKNKFLRQREIIKGKTIQVSELQLLQQQYTTIAKKEEFLLQRVQIIQQELVDIDFSLSQQKQYYNELKSQLLTLTSVQSVIDNKNLQAIYTSKKRKLELNWKRHQRENEAAKKKYYQLLVDFQNHKKRIEEINNKIFIAKKENQFLVTNIQFDLKKYQINNSRGRQVKMKTQLGESTQVGLTVDNKKENIIKELISNKSNIHIDNRESFQNKFNKINVNDRNLARKWNIDSIKQQDPLFIKEHQIQYNLLREDVVSLRTSDSKCIPSSKQILHLRTQSTPTFDNESIVSSEITFIEEQYSQEFDHL